MFSFAPVEVSTTICSFPLTSSILHYPWSHEIVCMRSNDIGAAFVYQPCIHAALYHALDVLQIIYISLLIFILFRRPSLHPWGLQAMTFIISVRTRRTLSISPNIIMPFTIFSSLFLFCPSFFLQLQAIILLLHQLQLRLHI